MEKATQPHPIMLEQLLAEVKKMRSLQDRFWKCQVTNTMQQDAKKKLLFMCKQQETLVDKLIADYQSFQQFLAL